MARSFSVKVIGQRDQEIPYLFNRIRHSRLILDDSLMTPFKLLVFPLCSGAYGEVRKCLNKDTKSLRAVKIINKKYLEEDEKAKLLSEINILKQMDHPNILKLYEFFQDHKRYFLVTE